MGYKGHVKRRTDGHFIHCNIDVDLIIAPEVCHTMGGHECVITSCAMLCHPGGCGSAPPPHCMHTCARARANIHIHTQTQTYLRRRKLAPTRIKPSLVLYLKACWHVSWCMLLTQLGFVLGCTSSHWSMEVQKSQKSCLKSSNTFASDVVD